MKRHTVVDISKYTFQEAEHSFCRCGRSVFLLMTREPDRDAPAFYMCAKCGRIAQVGVGPISQPEAGISKAVEDGAVFGEEAKAACEASRRTMRKLREEDDFEDAACLDHAHRTREEEAICSLRFQITRLKEESANLRNEVERLQHEIGLARSFHEVAVKERDHERAVANRLRDELEQAYIELRKLHPSLTAVFDRAVHERARKDGGKA